MSRRMAVPSAGGVLDHILQEAGTLFSLPTGRVRKELSEVTTAAGGGGREEGATPELPIIAW